MTRRLALIEGLSIHRKLLKSKCSSMSTVFILLLCILTHLLLLAALGMRRSQLNLNPTPQQWPQISATIVQGCGLLTVLYTFALPVVVAEDDPVKQCVLRVVAFFYGCKTLDLTLTKAHDPPESLEKHNEVSNGSILWRSITRYALLLFTEMRYHSFDIAIHQTQRPSTINHNIKLPFLAMAILGTLDYILSLPALKCTCLLLLLQVSLEATHSVMHRRCPHPLFYEPFSAPSAGDFWATHWHAAAAPFLQSLAYLPGRKLGGRWLGVIATFNLTGIWHGWASAALVDDDHAFMLAAQVWGFFMLQGAMCVAERVVWGKNQGGMVQRVLVWTISIGAAGQCFRSLERHTNLSILSAKK